MRASPAIDRLMAKIVEDENGCWIFTGTRTPDGYGAIKAGRPNHNMSCHRLAYEYFIAEIPDGLQIDHLCRVRSCCNPWHLEPVTQSINQQRGLAGRDLTRLNRTHCPTGHPFDDVNTYLTGTGHRQCRTCKNEASRRYRARRAAA